MSTVRIFTDDIRMKFGISKCATLVMKRERKAEDNGSQMPGGIAIEDFDDEAYKYLGVQESAKIKIEKVKLNVMQIYDRKVKKVLNLNLNRRKAFKVINVWAVAAVRYTAGIVD